MVSLVTPPSPKQHLESVSSKLPSISKETAEVMLRRLIYLCPVSGSNNCWDDFHLAKLMRNRI